MIDTAIKIDVNAVRLQQAVLCAGCDVISDSPHDACLVCGSRSLLPLSRVLGSAGTEMLAPAASQPQRAAGSDKVLVLTALLSHRGRRRSLPPRSR